jgi:16S rRNA (guanine966-N2)-methyltransferase
VGEQRVRIVAGEWRGRRLDAVKGSDTRPTADRVREAVFSSLASLLGPSLGAARVLDAFAGTGALGLEALSRGAATATFVESDGRARVTLEGNVRALGADARSRIVAGDAFTLAPRAGLPGGPFGLILLDPPYRIEAARVRKLLEDLRAQGLAAAGTAVVWEHASGTDASWPDGFEARAGKRYGSTAVDIAVVTADGT